MQAFVKRRQIRDPNATEAYVRKILVRTATRRPGDRWRKVALVEESPKEVVSGTSEMVTDRLTLLSAARVAAVAGIGIQAVQERLRDVEERREIRMIEWPGDRFLEHARVCLPC
jgi:hypothetical protein